MNASDPDYKEFIRECEKLYSIFPQWWWDSREKAAHFISWLRKRETRAGTICYEQVGSRITKNELARLNELVKKTGGTKSAFIREAIVSFMDSEKGEK